MAKTSKKTTKGQQPAAPTAVQKVATSSAARAHLTFPPAKFQRLLRRGRHARRVSPTAGIFLAGCLEWLTQEILECMMQAAQKSKSSMLHPRHVMGAILGDEELSVVFNNVVIMKGGMGSSALAIESCFGGGKAIKKKQAKKGLPIDTTNLPSTEASNGMTGGENDDENDEEMSEKDVEEEEDEDDDDEASSEEANPREHSDSQEF